MSPTHYERGRAFEHRIKERLEDQGYFVIRAAGSKGLVDLIAYRENACLFIQAKGGARSMTRRERMELVDLAARYGATPVLYSRGMKVEVLSDAA